MFYLGVDVGTSSVKALVVRKKGKRLEHVEHLLLPISSGFVKAGAIADPEGIGSIISSQAESIRKFRRLRVVASISARQVISRMLVVPLTSEKEIKSFLELEVERLFPGEEAVYDFNVIGHTKEGAQVIVVATYRKIVDALVRSLEVASIFPQIVDVDTIALVNLYNRTLVEGVSMLLDIGAGGSRIAVFEGDNLLLLRSSIVGGNMVNNAISHTRQVDFSAAEKIKLSGEFDDELMATVEPIFEDLYKEVVRAFDYLIGTYRENPVKRIYLTGGGSLTPGLLRWLQERVSVPVSSEDRWNDIDTKDMTYVERKMFEVSLGLIFRGIER